ncbi:RNA-directed DNA polymerase, eukaryota [Tanacetum coccineum]
MRDERFIAIKGEWKGRDIDVFLVCVYGPHVGRQKASLWERLMGLMFRWNGAWCIFGDLNVVRRFINLWGNLSVLTLDRKLSNHFPIVLKDVELDFGPKPFRFFDIWLDESDIGQVVELAWRKEVSGNRLDCRFRDKLKNVKVELKK